jgi:hypothetical protein
MSQNTIMFCTPQYKWPGMREIYDEEKLIVECYRQPIAYHIVVLCTYHESANAHIARPWISLCGFQLPAQSGSDGALGFVQNSGCCDCMLVYTASQKQK